MSSEYKKLLHEKSVRSALVKRDASALNINNLADKLKGLKDKPFNPRIFNNFMKEFIRMLADLKQAQSYICPTYNVCRYTSIER